MQESQSQPGAEAASAPETPASRTDTTEAMAGLAARLRGSLVAREHPGFDAARRIWNGMIERRPRAIARCIGTADVRECINFARENGLPVSVRGGGHNVSGNAIAEDGLVVDLSGMRSVRVDPVRSTVRAEGGALLGDLDRETQAFGLAVPVGVVSATGIGGLSLHGGMGFLTRRFGLASDNLIAADVVTADGAIRFTDETHEPDLLWALRGGGGIGVVTSLEFRAHPVGPEVYMGIVMYPASEASRIVPVFRSFMAEAPDEMMGIAIYWSAPHGEPVAPENQGAPVIALVACWTGPLEEGASRVQPLRELGAPIADLSGPFPYTVAQSLFDPEYPNGRRYYWKSAYLNRLDDEVIAVLNEYSGNRPSPISSVDVWFLGGAYARVDPGATAFARRNDPYLLGIEANWTEAAEDDANVAWARALFEAVRPFSDGGAYFNFPGFLEEGDAQVRRSFGGNYDRLRDIQRRYDPDGLFRHALAPARSRENQA